MTLRTVAHKIIYTTAFLMVVPALVYGNVQQKPIDKAKLSALYATPERSAEVVVNRAQTLHQISPHFLGINTSYFNDTDAIWNTYDFPSKLKKAGIGSMRYPGGEEISFFHWEHPGVNGYEDLWDPPAQHGNSKGRGPFQDTWIHPEAWTTNTNFMSFDDFMANCAASGAEPVVGINLSSGRKHNRREDGLAEALRWMRYCKEKDYKVKYWYLDNEPWNKNGAYAFGKQEYAEEFRYYGEAIKKEFPGAKLIANACRSRQTTEPDYLKKFLLIAGEYTDYIDTHWYWEWSKASFKTWRVSIPMNVSQKLWRGNPRTYVEETRMIRDICTENGFPGIGVVALEWNIGPSDDGGVLSQAAVALIHGEMLMQFMEADIEISCLWTLLWRSDRNVWPEQNVFPSIISQDPPYAENLSLELFRMLSSMQGKTMIESRSNRADLPTIAAESDGQLQMLLLNKSPLRRKVTLTLDSPVTRGNASIEWIGLQEEICFKANQPLQGSDTSLDIFVEPFSITSIKTGTL